MTHASRARGGQRPNHVYVASSWANDTQPIVCRQLAIHGIPHYDFRNPGENTQGFHWSEVMSSYTPGNRAPGAGEQKCLTDDYLEALEHPRSIEAFNADYNAMWRSDACILILPAGRSGHSEIGWFAGKGRRTAVLLDGPHVTPELMYKMYDFITDSLDAILNWCGCEVAIEDQIQTRPTDPPPWDNGVLLD